jgi:hypothetical protein
MSIIEDKEIIQELLLGVSNIAADSHYSISVLVGHEIFPSLTKLDRLEA